MPLAAITPPATLTVAVSVSQQMLTFHIPTMPWANVSFAKTGGCNKFYDAASESSPVCPGVVIGARDESECKLLHRNSFTDLERPRNVFGIDKEGSDAEREDGNDCDVVAAVMM